MFVFLTNLLPVFCITRRSARALSFHRPLYKRPDENIPLKHSADEKRTFPTIALNDKARLNFRLLAFHRKLFKIKTRRLQRRSLRLPTRSKSAQTGHLCTTAQAGADPGIFVCRSKFLGLKVGRRS